MFKFLSKRCKIIFLQLYILRLASFSVSNKSFGNLRINGLRYILIDTYKKNLCFKTILLFSLLCLIIAKLPGIYTITIPISIFILCINILYTMYVFMLFNRMDSISLKDSYHNMRQQIVYHMLVLFNHNYNTYNKCLFIATTELKTYYPTINNKQYLQILKDIELYSITKINKRIRNVNTK